MLFHKKNKRDVSIEKDEIEKNMYDLGFEVGYFNHRKEGWVYKKYKDVLDLARDIDIDKDIDDHYQRGRTSGKQQRRSDIGKGLSAKFEPAIQEEERVKVGYFEPDDKSGDTVFHEKRDKPVVNTVTKNPGLNKEPEVSSKPKVLKKAKVTNIPGLLK